MLLRTRLIHQAYERMTSHENSGTKINESKEEEKTLEKIGKRMNQKDPQSSYQCFFLGYTQVPPSLEDIMNRSTKHKWSNIRKEYADTNQRKGRKTQDDMHVKV